MIPIWLLVFGTAGAMLVSANFLSPYFGLIGGTLALHLLPLVGFLVTTGLGLASVKDVERKQFWVCVVTIGLMIMLTFGRQLQIRGNGPIPLGIHDGAVHTEEAAKVFLNGENPYTANYRATPYAQLNPVIPGGPTQNVVWSHYIYPPLTFLLQAPWQWFGNILGLVADVRWIWMIAFILVSGFIIRAGRTWTERSQWLLLTLGNPLLWTYAVIGYNDFLPALGLVVGAWGMARRRWWLAGMAVGLALASKQSAWIALLLWAMWIWWLHRHSQAQPARQVALATLGTLAVTVLPFFLWSPAAFYDDVVRYASGAIPYSYPISGSTILQYLRVFGLIDSPWSVTPTYLIQLAVGIPVTWLAWRWWWRKPNAGQWLGVVSFVILSVLLVSRYFNSNYLIFIQILVMAGLAFRPEVKHEAAYGRS